MGKWQHILLYLTRVTCRAYIVLEVSAAGFETVRRWDPGLERTAA